MRSRRRATAPGERRVFSVRTRIVVAILLVAALGLVASGVATYFVQRQRALSQVDQDLLREVADFTSAASRAKNPAPTTVDQLLRVALQETVPGRDESLLGIIDGKAALVPGGNLAFRMDQDKTLVSRFVSEADATNVVIGTAKTETATIRYVIVPVSVAGDAHKGLYVVGYDLDAVLGAIAESFQVYAIVAVGALLIIGLVAWFVAGRLLRPLRLLREAVARNSASDLTQRIAVTGNDDISKLTVSMNVMFDRLEQSFVAQRRLLDDVGHELKTPITIVRGHLELLDATEPIEVESTRALAIDELDRMSELVSEISLLAESRGPGFVQSAPVDLGQLTPAVFAKASALAPDRDWVLDESAEGVADLDIRRITQAWLQLADNAVKYSAADRPIHVGSSRVEGRNQDLVQFWVRDEGDGIEPADRERVFERFVRLDSARSLDGSGLGLAIVAAIVSAHGGHVDLLSGPGGSTFTMRLPTPSAKPAAHDDREENETDEPDSDRRG